MIISLMIMLTIFIIVFVGKKIVSSTKKKNENLIKQSASGGFGMTKNNVIYDEEDLEMLSDLKDAKENGLDFIFTYRGNSYRIEFVSGIVLAYMEKENAMEFRFQNIDDLMEHYMIDGEPFKTIIPEIDSYYLF